MLNSTHFAKIVSTLPNPGTRYQVCPRIDFDRVGCIQHACKNIFNNPWLSREINYVLTFARVTAIGSEYYPNTLNFTLINVYLADNQAIEFTNTHPYDHTEDFSGKLATFLHVVLNDTVDQKINEVRNTLFKCKYEDDPIPVDFNEKRIQTPIIFVEKRKVKEKLDFYNSKSKKIFEKQYSIDGQNCPDICYNLDIKWYKNFIYTHSIDTLDPVSRPHSQIRAIEVMNGAYTHLDYFEHNDDYEIEFERINQKINPLYKTQSTKPYSLFNKINEFFRDPGIVYNLPRYPVNDGWNVYFSTLYDKYLDQYGMISYGKRTSCITIDWKQNALKAVRECSYLFGYISNESEYNDDDVIENASEDARYNFTNYNNWVIEKNKFPYDLYLPH